MRIKVQHGDEELTFKPDEFHAKQQDARQNAALQFIKWLAHWQMTGEKLVLREDSATHDTDAEGEEEEHETETERVTLKEEELTAPVFAYFDFVRAMAQQFKLNHEAEVWAQHAPVAAEDKIELERREIQDMLGDLSLMKIILEPGHKLVEGDVKAYRGKFPFAVIDRVLHCRAQCTTWVCCRTRRCLIRHLNATRRSGSKSMTALILWPLDCDRCVPARE